MTNSVLVQEINQSRLDLYEKLLDAGACDYFESSANVNVVTNTASYDLPDRYHTTLGVDVLLDGGDYATLDRYNFQDRNLYSNSVTTQNYGTYREDTHYRVRGDFITFYPTPQWTQTNGIKHIYVAVPADLNTASTVETIDGFYGWEDYIVMDCLVKFIGGKEEGDAQQWMQERSKVESRIERMKRKRDRGGVDTIANLDREHRRYRRWGKSV